MDKHTKRTINNRLLQTKFGNYSVTVDNLTCESSCLSNLYLDFQNSVNSDFSVLGYSSSDFITISSLQVTLEGCQGINDTVPSVDTFSNNSINGSACGTTNVDPNIALLFTVNVG